MKWNTKEKEKCCKREEVAALMKLMSRNKPEEVGRIIGCGFNVMGLFVVME